MKGVNLVYIVVKAGKEKPLYNNCSAKRETLATIIAAQLNRKVLG